MAPDTYRNTYKTYKEGTKRITTWLVNSARRCGADLEFLNSSSQNGSTVNGNTNAKKKYDVPLKHFISLSQTIAQSVDPKIVLPDRVSTLIQIVIDLRKEANAFFERFTTSETVIAQEGDDGHKHFILILERVLAILRPSSRTKESKETTASLPPLTNLFEALSVEEPSDIVEDEQTQPRQRPAHSTTPVEYDIESSEQDAIFALFAFFQDVNEIRDYVQGAWRDYRQGNLDVMSAAATTDTAFALLKYASDDIQDADVGVDSYPTIATVMICHLGETTGHVPIEFSDWICFRTVSLLQEFENVLKVNPLPIMIPGALGTYNPKDDRSELSTQQKDNEDRIVLMELLPELAKISRANKDFPGQDLLTAGLKDMMATRSLEALPMHVIFATQILLDIHHVLREDVEKPFGELQTTAQTIISTVDGYFKTSQRKTMDTWTPEHNEMLRHTRTFAKEWVLEDWVAGLIKTGPGARHKNQRSFHLLKNNPVLSGLLVFQLHIRMNEIGIALANAWGSAVYPAHLYNAAHHSAQMEQKWDDMEYIINIHTVQRLFVGSPPTEVSQYLKRFVLALGGSATNFARNRRKENSNLIVESKKGPRGLKTTSPVKDIFRARYVEDGALTLSTPNVVAMVSVATTSERARPPSLDMAAFAKTMLLQKSYSTLQLLQAVREGVAGEELHLRFDYFGLHQRAYKLLQGIRADLNDDLVGIFGSNYLEGDHQLPYVVGYIFEALAEYQSDTGEMLLRKASNVLSGFLERGQGSKSIDMAKERSRGDA